MTLTACGDDDAADDATPQDAAMEAAVPPERDAGGMDGGRRDAGSDAGDPDAGDGGDACPREDFLPLWDQQFETSATRVPLEVVCGERCNQSLTEFSAGLDCEPVPEDGGLDALDVDSDGGGIYSELFRYWIRREGCDSVQFDTLGPGWPRHYNFDADSGELIGYAKLDDVVYMLTGSTCESAGWVGGVIRQSCDEETLMLCKRR